MDAYAIRREAERIVGEDRVPTDVLQGIIDQFGDKPEGAIEWDLVVSVDGVFTGPEFDVFEETIEAAGEALRIKRANPEAVVSLVVVERPVYPDNTPAGEEEPRPRDVRGEMLYRQDSRP